MSTSNRIQAIDSVRGIGMLFICISHFGSVYFGGIGRISDAALMTLIGKVATPTFVLVSAMMPVALRAESPSHWPRLRARLLDRGLFIVLVGHAILTVATAAARHVPDPFEVHITDLVGVGLLVAIPLLDGTGALTRVLLGVIALASTWVVMATGPIGGTNVAWAMLFALPPGSLGVSFPLIPWIGVMLLTGALVQRFLAAGTLRTPRLAVRSFALAAGISLSAAATLKLVYYAGVGLGVIAPGITTVWSYFSVSQKYPPGPVYLLLFGGIGLGILALSFSTIGANVMRPVHAVSSLVGRNSFVAFIAQSFVVWVFYRRAQLPYSPFWPLYLLGSLTAIVAIAWLWERHLGNRYLSLGLWRVFQRGDASTAAPPLNRATPTSVRAA